MSGATKTSTTAALTAVASPFSILEGEESGMFARGSFVCVDQFTYDSM
jgi:hypothetical protein